QQKRPVQRRAKLPPFCPQFIHALFELAAFLLKIKPQLYRNGNDLILISRHDSSSQPLICEPAFQFQPSTPEEAGESLRSLLLSGASVPTCSKTSHREVLLVSLNRQQAGNFFSYKKFPNRQEKFLLPI